MNEKKIVLMLAGESAHFMHHLLPIARCAQEKGYTLHVALKGEDAHVPLSDMGIQAHTVPLNRGSLNPLKEIRLLLAYLRLVKALRPDILHTFMMKPILYGAITGRLLKVPHMIHTYLGLGTLFLHETLLMRMMRALVCLILRLVSTKHTVHVTQNADDADVLRSLHLGGDVVDQCSVGVDMEAYTPTPEPSSPPLIFALVGRMLWDKGVQEFVAAARMLNLPKTQAEFWLVGTPDFQNRHSVSLDILRSWDKEGVIVYKGFQDTKALWHQAHVAVLPSYREGLSRALLEAAACARAVITTDAPGGRTLVTDRKSGLLVRPHDPVPLAEAMARYLDDPDLRRQCASALHKNVCLHYTARICAYKTVALYDERVQNFSRT